MLFASVLVKIRNISTKMDYKAWRLFAISDINEGEELTLTYTFYKI